MQDYLIKSRNINITYKSNDAVVIIGITEFKKIDDQSRETC